MELERLVDLLAGDIFVVGLPIRGIVEGTTVEVVAVLVYHVVVGEEREGIVQLETGKQEQSSKRMFWL